VSLAEVVASVAYKPGWKVWLRTMNGVPHLWIEATVPDSNPPHGPLRIGHVLTIPSALTNPQSYKLYDDFYLRRWVYDQLLAIERHELGEWLRFGDERPYLPSHDGASDRYDEPAR